MQSLFDRTARDPRYGIGLPRRSVPGAIPVACIAFASAWILAYAALIPLGEWRADEYDTFFLFREKGLDYLWYRTTHWSFRPLSELVLYVYAQAAHLAQRPLILPFLAFLWAGLLASAIAPALSRRTTGAQALLALCLPLTLLALFLGGRRVDEAFYWTQGAVAYVPTIAAITHLALSNVLADGENSRRLRIANALAGVVAALSSEIGATFATAYGGAALAATILGRFAARTRPLVRRRDVEFLPPLIAGSAVLLVLASGRLGTKLETFGDKAVAHHHGISLRAALEAFPHEILSAPKGSALGAALGSGSFILPLLALGAYGVFRMLPRPKSPEMPARVVAIAAALFGAALLSLFAGFYQFGTDCCSRHEATRYPMVALAVVCLAFVAAGWSRRRSEGPPHGRTDRWTFVAPLSLMAAAGLNGAQTFGALSHDFGIYGARWAQAQANWAEGLSPSPDMAFAPTTGRFICWQHILVDGTYGTGPDAPANARYVARYFDKSQITIKDVGDYARPCPPV